MRRDCAHSGSAAQVALEAILCLLLSCPGALALDPSLEANQYAHTAWKISEGFCKGTIHAIAQTPDGFLWLATEFGLLRFDGVRTVAWAPPPNTRLPSKDIRSLVAGPDGTLWLGTAKGLVSWNNGHLTQYPQFDGHDVHTLLQDHNGTLWASGTAWEAGPAQTGNTVVCSMAGGRTSCYGQDGSFGGYGVTGMYEDHRGNLWMAAANGLWRWAPGLSQHYAVPELNQRRTAGLTFSSRPFAESSGGSLLIASPDGLSEFADGKFRRFQLPPGAPLFGEAAVLRDRDGALWIGTADTGLLHLHLGKIDSFDESDGLSGNAVQNLFEDREGNVWIGTRNGLDRFREYTVPSISAKQGLSTSFVLSVLASRNGSIWMGTPNGLNRWNNGEVTIYRTGESARTHPQAGRQGLAVRELAAAGLPDNFVGSLYEDPQGRLWVSTARGIAYFQNGKFTPMPGVHIPSWSWSVSPVAQDASGTLWTTGDQGLYRISGGHVAEYLSPQKVGLRGLLSCFLAPDKIGGLWLGSWDGGVAYLKAGTPVASFGPAQGLGSGRVNVVKLDTENTLLAGTDGGLSRIKDGKVSTLTTKNGLPCDTIHALAEDTDHSLWLYTACGLVHISKPELSAWIADPMRHIQVSVFDASDGVKSHAGVLNFGPRMTRSPDGKLWFVPLAGVGVVDPHRLSPNKLPPPVHIEQITADRKTYDVIAGRKAALRLPPLVKDLTIDYTALSLVAPEKTHFRFKLDGQDRDWREAVNKREVQYSNLAPATYRFHVMACNNTGVWNQEGDTIEFSIAPAYYQTSWFRVASVATFGALLWGLYAWRVLRLQRQERQLREVVETVPAMAWIALPDGTCTFANKRWAEYTDLSPEETAGSGWISAIHKQDSESYLRHWRASLASGERFEDQARFRHGADGEYRWFLVRGVPMRDEHGNIVRWYGTMTDIEDRKRSEDQIKALNERLFDSQEAERARIARDLHDDLSQQLATLSLQMSGLQSRLASTATKCTDDVVAIRRRINEVATRVRQFSHELHPELLHLTGLQVALKAYCDEFSSLTGIAVTFQSAALPKEPKSEAGLCLYRIAQEALQNIRKHAPTANVKVQLTHSESSVTLIISDDGPGFDPSRLQDGHGLGLLSMKERVGLVGGTFYVESAPDKGTTVLAQVSVE